MPPRPFCLRPLTRVLAVAINVGVGLLPSAAFFLWIERNCSLPWIGTQLDWPWVSLPARFAGAGAAVLAVFDLALILGFGLIHSLCAQKPFYSAMEKISPPQLSRTVFLVITGVSVLGVMGLWQNTGVLLWALPLSGTLLNLASITLYLGFMGFAARLMSAHDTVEFVGLKQIYLTREDLRAAEAGVTRHLNRSGLYGRVRHPIYLFTLLAVAVTPFMSLDRAMVLAGLLGYLFFGIPMEERKLRAIFGSEYSEYQKSVPMLFPRRFFRFPFLSPRV